MTPEEVQKELLEKFREFETGLQKANTIAEEQENARIKRNKDRRKENVWYGFANSLIKGRNVIYAVDIASSADDLTNEFLQRFPNESN